MYAQLEAARDSGLLDKFVQILGNTTPPCDPIEVMG